jgi:DNA-binding transcriptional regulator YdaS (Cro superfamily)
MDEAAGADANVQECPTLRALGAFDNLLSQGAEGVRRIAAMRASLACRLC